MFEFEFTIIKSYRKTISIEIKNNQVLLRTPHSISNDEAVIFLKNQNDWVIKKLTEQKKILANRVTPQFKVGSTFKFLGQDYTLKLGTHSSKGIKIINQNMILGLKTASEDNIKTSIYDFYLKQANDFFFTRTELFSKIIKVSFASIVVKKYKSRWGSCSNLNKLTYNWLLIQAPLEIIDYVIIHELCHIIEHNHSKKFWLNVKKHCPDYKKKRQWLNKNGHSLMI